MWIIWHGVPGPGYWTPPMIQQLNWSRHLLSDWWHSQNPSASFHWPDYVRMRVSVVGCLCGTVEVIISSGRRDFLVPVVVTRGAVPGRDSQLVPFNSPPFCRPLSPPLLLFPLKLHSVNRLFPPWRGSALSPPSFDTGEKSGSEGRAYSVVYRERELERRGLKEALLPLLLSIRSSWVEELLPKCWAAGLFPPAGLSVICPCSNGREKQSRLEKVDSSGFAVFWLW